MAKLYGITIIDVIPQPDFEATQNENGGWRASQSFEIRKGGLDNASIRARFPYAATLRSLDPNSDIYYSFLKLSKINAVETIEGGYTRINVEFVGIGAQGGGGDGGNEAGTTAPTYALRGQVVEAPLDEHPKWKALSEVEKNALGKMLSGDYAYGPDPFEDPDSSSFSTYIPRGEGATFLSPDPISSTDAIEFATRIAQGRSTYKLATYEYTHRWEASVGPTAAQLNNLGKIATPSGNPPNPGSGRNYLLVGVNSEQHGTGDLAFTNELQYLLSDEGGHDSFLQS